MTRFILPTKIHTYVIGTSFPANLQNLLCICCYKKSSLRGNELHHLQFIHCFNLNTTPSPSISQSLLHCIDSIACYDRLGSIDITPGLIEEFKRIIYQGCVAAVCQPMKKRSAWQTLKVLCYSLRAVPKGKVNFHSSLLKANAATHFDILPTSINPYLLTTRP